MLWQEIRAGDFKDALERSGGVCVIPIGATEKHARHLPLGTDNFTAADIVKDAAKLADVMVFSTFEFGNLLGFQHHPGSICLSSGLIIDYLSEICSEIARNGFKKILLLSSHGGNKSILEVVAQKTQESKKDYVVLSGRCEMVHPSQLLDYIKERGKAAFPDITEKDIACLEDFVAKQKDWGHACFVETLDMLGVRPDTVDLSLMGADSGENTHRFDHLERFPMYSPYFWAGDYPNHCAGDYHAGADEALGRAMHELSTKFVAEMLIALKNDTELLKINDEWNKKW